VSFHKKLGIFRTVSPFSRVQFILMKKTFGLWRKGWVGRQGGAGDKVRFKKKRKEFSGKGGYGT
jgi:hypothetical protein